MGSNGKADIWMPIYIGDYLSDTLHLTIAQHGAYFLLMMAYWKNRGPLPEESIRSICKFTDNIEKNIKVLSTFFDLESHRGYWTHKRIEKELANSIKKTKAKAESGYKGACSKWGSNDNKKKRSERLAEARRKGTHTREEWEALASLFNSCPRCGGNGEPVRDHIIPIYQGGSDSIENIQPLCRSCNAAKGPESVDYRPNNWRERLAKCLANG